MSTKVSTPEAPPAPSTADSINAWVKSMPTVFAEQQRQAPLEAQQQVELAQQYAGQLGEAYKSAQEAMYPEETALRNELMSQAMEGATAEQLPDWMRNQYQDQMRANLGSNIGSGIGADYTSSSMMRALEDYKMQHKNMALSLSGSQPIYQAQSPMTSNYMSGFTPNSVMGYNAQNYGSYSNAYSSMYNANANVTASMNKMFGDMVSGVAGGIGTAMAP
jgi:uncharacterized protein YukE